MTQERLMEAFKYHPRNIRKVFKESSTGTKTHPMSYGGKDTEAMLFTTTTTKRLLNHIGIDDSSITKINASEKVFEVNIDNRTYHQKSEINRLFNPDIISSILRDKLLQPILDTHKLTKIDKDIITEYSRTTDRGLLPIIKKYLEGYYVFKPLNLSSSLFRISLERKLTKQGYNRLVERPDFKGYTDNTSLVLHSQDIDVVYNLDMMDMFKISKNTLLTKMDIDLNGIDYFSLIDKMFDVDYSTIKIVRGVFITCNVRFGNKSLNIDNDIVEIINIINRSLTNQEYDVIVPVTVKFLPADKYGTWFNWSEEIYSMRTHTMERRLETIDKDLNRDLERHVISIKGTMKQYFMVTKGGIFTIDSDPVGDGPVMYVSPVYNQDEWISELTLEVKEEDFESFGVYAHYKDALEEYNRIYNDYDYKENVKLRELKILHKENLNIYHDIIELINALTSVEDDEYAVRAIHKLVKEKRYDAKVLKEIKSNIKDIESIIYSI